MARTEWARKVKAWRTRHGLSQQAAAVLLHRSLMTVSRWENDGAVLHRGEVERRMEALDRRRAAVA